MRTFKISYIIQFPSHQQKFYSKIKLYLDVLMLNNGSKGLIQLMMNQILKIGNKACNLLTFIYIFFLLCFLNSSDLKTSLCFV